MGTAHVVDLTAQPAHSSLLAFEIGGILNRFEVGLGDLVPSIAYDDLARLVRQAGTVAGDPSRLSGDAEGVLSLAGRHVLASLRNEDRKTALDSAVGSRQNIFFAKYANAGFVISTIRGTYDWMAPTANPSMIKRLAQIANDQLVALSQAYEEDERTGVIKETTSSMSSTGRSQGGGKRSSQFYQESVGRVAPSGDRLPRKSPTPAEGRFDDAWAGYESMRFTTKSARNTAITTGVNYEESTNHAMSSGQQSATHVDYEYRTPLLEARARALRAQISLNDQEFEAYMFSQNIPHLEKIFANELAAVDNDIYQLQISLLRSLITSPIEGVVSAIYKEPGEAVSAGEPVLRVDDNSVARVSGRLAHPGVIRVGAAATLTTTLSGGGQPPTTVNGTVVSARGHQTGTRWEVVIDVPNLDGAGAVILPPGFVLDPEHTSIALV